MFHSAFKSIIKSENMKSDSLEIRSGCSILIFHQNKGLDETKA